MEQPAAVNAHVAPIPDNSMARLGLRPSLRANTGQIWASPVKHRTQLRPLLAPSESGCLGSRLPGKAGRLSCQAVPRSGAGRRGKRTRAGLHMLGSWVHDRELPASVAVARRPCDDPGVTGRRRHGTCGELWTPCSGRGTYPPQLSRVRASELACESRLTFGLDPSRLSATGRGRRYGFRKSQPAGIRSRSRPGPLTRMSVGFPL